MWEAIAMEHKFENLMKSRLNHQSLWFGWIDYFLSSTDKRVLVSEGVLNIVACKDGRQLLTISKVSKKDAGLYECNATNALGTATSSCTIAVARKNKQRFS